jgi:hypothetical protein
MLLAPSLSVAQSGEASPFRPKQWGVEFGLGGNFASVGLLRFQTAQRALLFDVEGSVLRQTPVDGPTRTSTGGAARLGVRRYRNIQPAVVGFGTLGALVSGGRTTNFVNLANNPPQKIVQSTVGAGAFADIGAAWMVTPNLSLGAVWSTTLDYTRSDSEVLGVSRSSSAISLAFGSVGLRGNIFF